MELTDTENKLLQSAAELSRLHEVTGIEFEAVPKTLKVEEEMDAEV